MTDECVERILGGIKGFQDEMKQKQIHVGMPDDRHVVRCVSCGEEWPCKGSRPSDV